MSIREGWNFHNDIALDLETIAKRNMKLNNIEETIFYADNIESGTFAEVMLLLLREKTAYKTNDGIKEFSIELKDILGMKGNDINSEVAEELYERFKTLIRF